MRNFLFAIALVALAASHLYEITFTVGGELPYKAIVLPPEVVNVAGTSAIRLKSQESGQEVPFFVYDQEQIHGVHFETIQSNGITTVTITGLYDTDATMQNIRVSGIRIITDSIFRRDVRINNRTITLYRHVFQDEENSNTFIPITGTASPATLSFEIINHNDSPINILGIEVEYIAHKLVFRSTGGEYRLVFGGELTRPRYDIEHFRDYILEQGFDIVPISGEARLIDLPYEGRRNFSWMFNAAVIIAGVVLIAVVLMNVVKKKENK